MFACPHCGQITIGTWRKFNASSTFPAKCASCGGLAFVSGWAHAGSTLAVEVSFWGTIVAAIVLKNWLALLVFPLGLFVWSLIIGRVFSLKPITPLAVSASRRSAAIQVFVASVIMIAVAMLFGSK